MSDEARAIEDLQKERDFLFDAVVLFEARMLIHQAELLGLTHQRDVDAARLRELDAAISNRREAEAQ